MRRHVGVAARRRSVPAIVVVAAGALATVCGLVMASASSLTVSDEHLTAPGVSDIVVPRAVPSLSTAASAGGPVGSTSVTDTVSLTGATANAGGTLTFTLWDPGSCTVAFGQSSVPVHGDGTYSSDPLEPLVAGTYHWTVTYDGDTNNDPVTVDTCGAAGETVTLG